MDYKKISETIQKKFGKEYWVEKDKNCDIRLVELWMTGWGERQPEEKTKAVFAFILYTFPEISTIAYGGVYCSARTILCGIFNHYLAEEAR